MSTATGKLKNKKTNKEKIFRYLKVNFVVFEK